MNLWCVSSVSELPLLLAAVSGAELSTALYLVCADLSSPHRVAATVEEALQALMDFNQHLPQHTCAQRQRQRILSTFRSIFHHIIFVFGIFYFFI